MRICLFVGNDINEESSNIKFHPNINSSNYRRERKISIGIHTKARTLFAITFSGSNFSYQNIHCSYTPQQQQGQQQQHNNTTTNGNVLYAVAADF